MPYAAKDYAKLIGIWKIAGLPNPGKEANMFKTWEPLGF